MHSLVEDCSRPAELLTRLNRVFLRRGENKPFVTCLAMMIPPAGGDWLIATAGHPSPVCIRAGRRASEIELPGKLMLGIELDVCYEDTAWPVPSDALAVLAYTDGVTEAMDANRDLFGEERLLAATCSDPADPPEVIIDRVIEAVQAHRGGCEQGDDLTILACRRC